MQKLSPEFFKNNKREKLLDYKVYSSNFDETSELLEIVRESLMLPKERLDALPPENIMMTTSQGAWMSLDLVVSCYSAGHPLIELRSFFASVLNYWEEYTKYSKVYNDSLPDGSTHSAHIPLGDDDYSYANQLLSFALLFGYSNRLKEIASWIDYNNPQQDGMLERILTTSIDRATPPPSECIRHLPYFKTIKIFDADAPQRSDLMREYLEDWYQASRREAYYDSHKRNLVFKGYWSWEAAAITFILGIDDTCFQNAAFYPKDLVDFAHDAEVQYTPAGTAPLKDNELRTKAGDPCPRTGEWESLDIPHQVNTFTEGEIIPNLGSHYGLTIWKYLG
ncbi:PoNe immunity protein domain-containing protein [Pseudoduganella namucuonensis]|uniref:DUF1911 domain-containing protein n=1 Tax=Pseudoduganella namucuonensis TaxID=1035707 RepID=A0A1I7JFF7_9BURK|nr:PoNe immunity protein domain-containing protein [Pseudoduganella namucuonensis]SFU83925.1 protein of unknown function [Pseudoduganella namucuonensis]